MGNVTLRFKQEYREWTSGDILTWSGLVTEDEGNYYVHGYTDEYPTGIFSNYLTLPKYAVHVLDGNERIRSAS